MRWRDDARLARLVVCSIVLAAAGLAAHALPRGYKDDFNGCATQSPDDTDRARCCKETFDQCQTQCDKDFVPSGDFNGAISCKSDCLWAHEKCKDGKTVALQPGWPGRGGAVVMGLQLEGDRAVPESGLQLVASRSAVLVELRGPEASGDAGCAAFVVACQCPPGAEARGQECRAWVDGKTTACRICGRGAAVEACKPCPECRPELLSSQPCAVPERPAPSAHVPKK